MSKTTNTTNNVKNPFKQIRNPNREKTPGDLKKNYDKNICRYLTRKTIRCFAHPEYRAKVVKFCNNDEKLYMNATEYFIRRIELITGFRVLKDLLDIEVENDL